MRIDFGKFLIRGGLKLDLSTNFMGLKLNNPIIIAAGPISASGEMMKKATEAGAGAVVTKTIVNEIRPNVRPRLYKGPNGIQNIELYSEFSLEEWENEIGYAKDNGATVIANILAHTPSEIAYIAKRVERFGADAIELGLSCPYGEGLEILGSNPAKLHNMVKSVVERVQIPVMVKLSSNVDNLAKLAKAAENAGASAISAIDTVRSIIGVDIDRSEALLPTYGGYSGDGIRPIGLAAVATISQAVSIPVCGIGGISSHKNIVEYMMLGASTIQVCSSIMLNGLEYINIMKQGLIDWLQSKGYEGVHQLTGRALPSLKSFEEIILEPYHCHTKDDCNEKDCYKCKIVCTNGAIVKSASTIIIDKNLCTGCGLCVSICPIQILRLSW